MVMSDVDLHVAVPAWFRWWATDGSLCVIARGQGNRRLARDPAQASRAMSEYLSAKRGPAVAAQRRADDPCEFAIGGHRYAARYVDHVADRFPGSTWHVASVSLDHAGGVVVAMFGSEVVAVVASLRPEAP